MCYFSGFDQIITCTTTVIAFVISINEAGKSIPFSYTASFPL